MAPYFIDFSGPVYIPGTRNIRDLSIVVIEDGILMMIIV